MAEQVVRRYFLNVLNLGQLTKPKLSNKIDPDKARDILDTNIFELLPPQSTRQAKINSFFQDFDSLIGPKPAFEDVDGDGVGESPLNYVEDEESRISHEDQPNAFITRLDSQAINSTINQDKTLESMRNKLNTYLGDVDNVIEDLGDQRPDYENKSSGFLKIRKPNQAIIITSQNEDRLLDFQKPTGPNNEPSFLHDGFTLTMWVRFVSKISSGTLFNFGNPTSTESPYGFKLDTVAIQDSTGRYRRMIRLIVRDHINDKIYDSNLPNPNSSFEGNQVKYNTAAIGQVAYRPGSTDSKFFGHIQIPSNKLNDWYFICATYNPLIDEQLSFANNSEYHGNKQYWLNHIDPWDGSLVSNAEPYGAKCKVELISRTDLLTARGYKINDLSVSTTTVSDSPPDADEPPLEMEDVIEDVAEETTTLVG